MSLGDPVTPEIKELRSSQQKHNSQHRRANGLPWATEDRVRNMRKSNLIRLNHTKYVKTYEPSWKKNFIF